MVSGEPPDDLAVRLAAFRWLEEQTRIHGEVLPWSLLSNGFVLDGSRVPLVSMQGIFKPRVCRLPLTIRTAVEGPYSDSFGPSGLLLYKYRGSDPSHHDNEGLRQARKRSVPLIYLHGHLEGRYHAIWPVFVVGDSPETLTFTVAADQDEARLVAPADLAYEDPEIRRRYVTATVRRRLHQQGFRERVLNAYSDRCALCRLRHRELLDASHIAPDASPDGEPVVSNGLALCKLHHAAFDLFILTVDPDYRVRIRRDVLTEVDGPMLKHGLQDMDGQRIEVPRRAVHQPSRDLLAQRLEAFLAR
jgi:putative restriction endonuclease